MGEVAEELVGASSACWSVVVSFFYTYYNRRGSYLTFAAGWNKTIVYLAVLKKRRIFGS